MLDEQQIDEGHAMKVWIPNQSGAPLTIRADREEAWLYSSHQLLSNDTHYNTLFRAVALMRPAAAAKDKQISHKIRNNSNQQQEQDFRFMDLEEKVLTTDFTNYITGI